jgi:hypothetical protein
LPVEKNSARADIEGPRQDERDWKSSEDKHDDEPRGPGRQRQRAQNGRGKLDNQPTDNAVADRDAKHFAPFQLAKKSVRP